MNKSILRPPFKSISVLLAQDSGQDLIEYSLLFGMIALAATAGMQSIAAGVSAVFGSISAILVSYTG